MMAIKVLTLALYTDGKQILLAQKKRGFGVGYYNGYGGKVEAGETIEQAASREVTEESGLTVTALEKSGVNTFYFENDPVALEVHVFKIISYTGEPRETEEMRPRWFALDQIPFGQMWADDQYWLPHFLAGEKFKGEYWFRQDHTMVKYDLKVVEEL